MMKGQISLEYMVLTVVAIALLSISVVALIKIKDGSEDAMEVVLFKSSARDLYNAISESCAMGDGNSRKVVLRTQVEVYSDSYSDYLEFSSPYMNNSIKYEKNCNVDNAELEGSVIVTNNDGTIEFT